MVQHLQRAPNPRACELCGTVELVADKTQYCADCRALISRVACREYYAAKKEGRPVNYLRARQELWLIFHKR